MTDLICPHCGHRIEQVVPVVTSDALVPFAMAMTEITMSIRGLQAVPDDKLPPEVLEDVEAARARLHAAADKLTGAMQ